MFKVEQMGEQNSVTVSTLALSKLSKLTLCYSIISFSVSMKDMFGAKSGGCLCTQEAE